MIRPAEALYGDVTPEIIFFRPVVYFSSIVRRDEDDFDAYDAASFAVDPGIHFEIRHYDGHPPLTATAYLPFEMGKNHDGLSERSSIIRNLRVPPKAIAWRRGDDFQPGELRRNEGDRLGEAEARVLALKVAALQAGGEASTELIKQKVRELYPLSPIDMEPSPTRLKEQKWQQIVGNVISHRDTKGGHFRMGYAERTADGLRITQKGMDYLKSLGFSL